jgi:hypothetical protein
MIERKDDLWQIVWKSWCNYIIRKLPNVSSPRNLTPKRDIPACVHRMEWGGGVVFGGISSLFLVIGGYSNPRLYSVSYIYLISLYPRRTRYRGKSLPYLYRSPFTCRYLQVYRLSYSKYKESGVHRVNQNQTGISNIFPDRRETVCHTTEKDALWVPFWKVMAWQV